jgi:Bacterial protein of unknown function (DUF922)
VVSLPVVFLERQAEAEKIDAVASFPEIAKPAPPVANEGDLGHEPDCVYRMDPIDHVCFGCCSVEGMGRATFSGDGGGDAKASAAPAADGAAPAADGGAGAAPAADGGAAGAAPADDNAAAGKTDDSAAGNAKQKGAADSTPAKVTSVKFSTSTGAAITIEGKNYKEMYQAVSARADLNQEGGKCKPEAPTVNVIYKPADPSSQDKRVESCSITVVLAISLPAWSGKGSQPAEDQAKFTAWYNSVKAHEDKHVNAFKSGVTAATVKPAGDKESDVDAALEAAFTANNAAQQSVDTSPPAPLAAPGGTEKVGANDAGAGAGDGKQAAAEGKPQAPAAEPPAGAGEAPKPDAPAAAA